MSDQDREINRPATNVIAVLETGDQPLTELPRLTGLDEQDFTRAVNYLKARHRLENCEGLLHLRPAESESSETPAQDEAPAPGEDVPAIEIILATYDYSELDTETAEYIRIRETMIRGLIKNTARNAIDIGRTLADAKEKLPHGQFGKWCEEALQISPSTASRFMRVSAKFANLASLDQIAPSAIYLLASESTPEEVIEEAVDRAESGEKVTHAEVKAAVEATHPPAVQPVTPTQTAQDADILWRALAGHTVERKQIATFPGVPGLAWHRLNKAISLLIADQHILEVGGGKLEFAPLPAAQRPDTTALVLDTLRAASGPQTIVQIGNALTATHGGVNMTALSEALRQLLVAGQIVKHEPAKLGAFPTYAIKMIEEPPADPAPTQTPIDDVLAAEVTSDSTPVGDRAGLPMPLDAAKGLIVDALRKSQRPLGRGELRKYADIPSEFLSISAEAINALLTSGAIAETRDEHGARRYHFPKVIAKLNAPEPAEDEPEASKAPRPVSPMLGVFEQDLRDLQLSMKAVMRQRFDWPTIPAERRDDLNALARETSRVAGALCQWFLALGDEIKLEKC